MSTPETPAYTIGELRRSFLDRKSDRVSMWVDIRGRIPLSELVEYVTARGIRPALVTVNFSTLRWEEDATEAEKACRAERQQAAKARHAEWKRRAYAELWAEFNGADPAALDPPAGAPAPPDR